MEYDITRTVDGDTWAVHVTPTDVMRLATRIAREVEYLTYQAKTNESIDRTLAGIAELLTVTIPGDTRITIDEGPGWRTTAPLFSHHNPEAEAAEPWGCDDCDNYAQNGARHCRQCEEARATADAYERGVDYRQAVQ